MGRTDDVINIAGHRLSTGEMEEVVAAHPAVAECSVIGVKDELKGQLPVGLVILKDGVEIDEATLFADLKASMVKQIGPIACFKEALIVNRLPKLVQAKYCAKYYAKLPMVKAILYHQPLMTQRVLMRSHQ